MFEAPTILSEKYPVIHLFLNVLRDSNLQLDRQRFRFNMERMGEVLALEISQHLDYQPIEVHTPLGTAESIELAVQPVLAVILRAALPLHQGFLRVFDQADNAFIAAYRKHTSENEFIVQLEYLSSPELTDRVVILLDPMIATGRSMVLSYEQLIRYGKPKQFFVAGVIGSEEGIEHVQRHLPHANIVVGAIDSELTARGYIVPGLGDAGDLAFGEKNG
jgi:uracil phosphoribosyltransferase